MAKKWKITRESSKDRRTIPTTKKLLKQLEEFKPSEIAKKLKISVQKWTAIKKDIKAGKIYGREANAELNKTLFDRRVKHLSDKPTKKQIKQWDREFEEKQLTRADRKRAREIIKELEADEKPKRKKKEYQYSKKTKRNRRYDDEGSTRDVLYYDDVRDLKHDQGKHPYKVASYPMSNYKDAYAWWKKVGAGKSYFAILKRPNKRTGSNYFYVVDIDPNRKRAGSNKKVNKYASHRADQILQKYLRNSGEDD